MCGMSVHWQVGLKDIKMVENQIVCALIVLSVFISRQTCSSGYDGRTAGSLALTGLLQVLNADVVHREERCRGSILWAHVGDGGPVGDGQLSNTWAEKLHKLSHDAHLAQVLTAQAGKGTVSDYDVGECNRR